MRSETPSQAAAKALHLRWGRVSMGLLSGREAGAAPASGSGWTVPAEPGHECCCARPRGLQ